MPEVQLTDGWHQLGLIPKLERYQHEHIIPWIYRCYQTQWSSIFPKWLASLCEFTKENRQNQAGLAYFDSMVVLAALDFLLDTRCYDLSDEVYQGIDSSPHMLLDWEQLPNRCMALAHTRLPATIYHISNGSRVKLNLNEGLEGILDPGLGATPGDPSQLYQIIRADWREILRRATIQMRHFDHLLPPPQSRPLDEEVLMVLSWHIDDRWILATSWWLPIRQLHHWSRSHAGDFIQKAVIYLQSSNITYQYKKRAVKNERGKSTKRRIETWIPFIKEKTITLSNPTGARGTKTDKGTRGHVATKFHCPECLRWTNKHFIAQYRCCSHCQALNGNEPKGWIQFAWWVSEHLDPRTGHITYKATKTEATNNPALQQGVIERLLQNIKDLGINAQPANQGILVHPDILITHQEGIHQPFNKVLIIDPIDLIPPKDLLATTIRGLQPGINRLHLERIT